MKNESFYVCKEIHRIRVNCGHKKKIKSRNWNKNNQKSLPFCGFHNWWCCTVHDSHETRCDDDDGDVDGRGVGRRRRSRAVAAAELELLEQLLEQPFLFGQKFRGQRTRHYSRKHGIVAKATSRTLRLPSRSQFQGKQVVNHHFLNQWNYSLVSFEKMFKSNQKRASFRVLNYNWNRARADGIFILHIVRNLHFLSKNSTLISRKIVELF